MPMTTLTMPSGRRVLIDEARIGQPVNRVEPEPRPIPPRAEMPEIAKARFAVCQGCPESKQDGFGCKLRGGCCFGKWRAQPESQCPAGKW